MKIFGFSDLHLEFYDKPFFSRLIEEFPEADVCCVAGDLGEEDSIQFCLEALLKKYEDVVYVAGNHEHYRSSLKKIDEFRNSLSLPGLHWLENNFVEIGGQRFIGGTLWFPDTPEARDPTNQKRIADFRYIADVNRAFDRNEESVAYLWNEVEEGDYVITHHTATLQSLAPRFRGSPMNCYFHNDLEALIAHMKPAIFHHGHTHDFFDYQCWDTRVWCNPVGYPYEHEGCRLETFDL